MFPILPLCLACYAYVLVMNTTRLFNNNAPAFDKNSDMGQLEIMVMTSNFLLYSGLLWYSIRTIKLNKCLQSEGRKSNMKQPLYSTAISALLSILLVIVLFISYQTRSEAAAKTVIYGVYPSTIAQIISGVSLANMSVFAIDALLLVKGGVSATRGKWMSAIYTVLWFIGLIGNSSTGLPFYFYQFAEGYISWAFFPTISINVIAMIIFSVMSYKFLDFSRNGSHDRDPCGHNQTSRRCIEIHRYTLIFALGYLVNATNHGVAYFRVNPPKTFNRDPPPKMLRRRAQDTFFEHAPKFGFFDEFSPCNSMDPRKSDDRVPQVRLLDEHSPCNPTDYPPRKLDDTNVFSPRKSDDPGPRKSDDPGPRKSDDPGPRKSDDPGPRKSDDPGPRKSDDPGPRKSDDRSKQENEDCSSNDLEDCDKIKKNPPVTFTVYEVLIGAFSDLITIGVMLLAAIHDIAIITDRNLEKHRGEVTRKCIRAEANQLSARNIKGTTSLSANNDYIPITNAKREIIGRAPPAQRPRWLSRNGQKQDTLDPIFWSITIADWVQFVQACIRTETWQYLISAKEEKDVTMYDLNEHFVKPWTKGTGCSVGGLFSNSPSQIGKVDIMISHAWAGSVQETMAAIQSIVSLYYLPKDTRIFFCTFCMYQPEDGAGMSIGDQLALNSFAKIIESRPKYGMFVVHTTLSEVYERMWCVHEVDEGLLSKIDIFGAFDSSSWNDNSFQRIVKSVKTKDAKCQEKDLVMLTKMIIDRGGFDRLDLKIAAFRKLAKQDLATALLFEELFSLNITSVDWLRNSFVRVSRDNFEEDRNFNNVSNR